MVWCSLDFEAESCWFRSSFEHVTRQILACPADIRGRAVDLVMDIVDHSEDFYKLMPRIP